MRILIATLPVALLVAYSQIIVKWRTASLSTMKSDSQPLLDRLMEYLADPYILSGYVAALLGSFIWLFLVAKLPLATAFPIYIGLTFFLVMLGGGLLLDEPLGAGKLIAAALILLGVTIGSRS
jgi:multidrug transporter EmrE-like cation transporter